MKQLSIFFSLMIMLTFTVEAGGIKKNEWHDGMIVLNGGHKLEGKIQYDLKQNIAILKKDDRMKAFSVYDINYFRFMDDKRKTLRNFYAMPYRQANGQERLMFFELVFEDDFALFNRETTVRKKEAALSEMPFVDDNRNSDRNENVKVFNYYVFTPDGKFVKIYTEKNDLADKLSLNREERKDMQRFIYENDLNLNNRSDFIRVIYEFV